MITRSHQSLMLNGKMPSLLSKVKVVRKGSEFRCPPCVENVKYMLITEKKNEITIKLILKIKFEYCEFIETFNILGKIFFNIY